MRRRERRESASADFYKRYAAQDRCRTNQHIHVDMVENQSEARHSELNPAAFLRVFFNRICCTLSYLIVAAAAFWFKSVSLLRLQVPETNGLDTVVACIDCSAHFSPFIRWRQPCAACELPFCGKCLELRHPLHDGSAHSTRKPSQVCSYCFFQLCARHCQGACCGTLSVGTLKCFLDRKGISTRRALEKNDLVASVHQWALDLAAAEYSDLIGGSNRDGGNGFVGVMGDEAL